MATSGPFGFSAEYGASEYGSSEYGQLTLTAVARDFGVPVEFVALLVRRYGIPVEFLQTLARRYTVPWEETGVGVRTVARRFGTPVEFAGAQVTTLARRFGAPLEFVGVGFFANWLAAGGGAPVWWYPDIYAQQLGYTSRGTYRKAPEPGLRIHTRRVRTRKGVRVRTSAPPAPQAAHFAPQAATFTAPRALPVRPTQRTGWAPPAPRPVQAPAPVPAPRPAPPVYERHLEPVEAADKHIRENNEALLVLL